MSSRLPRDFDADWYAATYRDVALSGLSPSEHYRRFGSLLGRPAKRPAKPEPAAPVPQAAVEPASPRPAPSPTLIDPAPSAAPAKVAQPSPAPKPKPKKESKIIDRPAGFDPLAAVPKSAPARGPGGAAEHFSLDTVANLEGSGALPAQVAEALFAYSRLLRLPLPKRVDERAEASCAARALQSGPTRVENAWLTAANRLRLMLKGHEEGATATGALALRAYQAQSSAPGDLHILGEGVQLPASGPVLHDVELQHPLMPLLLELADADGATHAFALMPFPSLLPGGLHGAELKALQTEPNPMDDFWSLSEALLLETIGGDGSPQRSVAAVSVAGEKGQTDQPLFDQNLQDWLTAVFQVKVDVSGSAEAGATQLRLPCDCVPTISALASRGLGGGTAPAVGPYLVAEAGSCRPRWSIAVPPTRDQNGAVPSLQPGSGQGSGAPPQAPAHAPLGIALRSPAGPLTQPSPTATQSSDAPPLSVVLTASNPDRAERLIELIQAASRDVEWLVRFDAGEGDLSPALDRACGAQEWTQLACREDLRKAASKARNEILLTISDRVEVGGALPSILELLNRDEKVASASCALVAEKIVKKDVVLQPASGGLFPTGVSFVSGPRLTFGEPNALEALPYLDYPVVANTLLFTAWRRSALAGLLPLAPTSTANVEDIRLGLDLMRSGFSNWCTTKVTARLSGPYVSRDQIDPVGAGYMHADAWEAILGRVTVVRELF